MPTPLRVLVLEDVPADAELMVHELQRAGFQPDWHRVETGQDYLSHLHPALDIVLADYRLPRFDALRALYLLQERGLDIPFIVVTGTIGEEAAVDCVKRGATDYVIKGRLARLGPAVTQALEAKRLRDEKRLAEAALRENEKRFRALIEDSSDVISILDANGVIRYESPSVERVLGYRPDEVVGTSTFDLVHPEDLKDVSDAFALAMRSPGINVSNEFRCRHKNGRWVRLEVVGKRLVHEGKEVLGVVNARDVTERWQAEEALKESQRWLAGILDASRDGIVVEENERIVYANLAFAHIYGYDRPEELMGQHLSLIHSPQDNARMLEFSRRRVAGEAVPPVYGFKGQHKDGRLVDLEASVGVMRIKDKPHIIAVVRDIADRKRLEEQLRGAQRMEAIGNLAGGIAHDFNNLLTVVLGYAELLLDQLDSSGPLRRDVEQIKNAGESAASLINRLLAFSRRQVLQPAVLDLNAVVKNIDGMLQRVIGEDIELTTVLDPMLWRVNADRAQLEQVIMNLVVNAHDAMPGGGRLTIETTNAELDDAYADAHPPMAPGRYVMLAVTDTGCGMDAETKARMFEPFFTTKPRGEGTGMGLPTVYGIVKQSGGYIWAYSEPNQGTTLKIYLPRTEVPVETVESDVFAPEPARGSETILLVEDQETVRSLAAEALRRQGYTVLEARNGGEAVPLAEQHEGPIDLLLTDVVLPGMNGASLVEYLVPLRPLMKVLYVSGYPDKAIVQHEVLKSGTNFLGKPFTPAKLVRTVREVLDRRIKEAGAS